MKHTEEFEKFLTEEVNLNKSRIETLNEKVETISKFITNNWDVKVKSFSPQGSWAHKTIIKPPKDKGFDADLVVYIDAIQGWEPKDYILGLRKIFTDSDLYKDIVKLRTRCVMLDYKGDFHLDIVPCIVNRISSSSYEVCNRADNKFEATNSIGYTKWFNERNTYCGNDQLQKATRLLKYLRDTKTTFSCKSILLSTLLGKQVSVNDYFNQNQPKLFPDIPTTLKTVVGRLDRYLQANQKMPTITNPALESEDFVRHWDEDKYSNFREQIHKYAEWIEDAYNETDNDSSIAKWRRVFGEDFGTDLLTEQAVAIKSMIVVPARAEFYKDAVEVAKSLGSTVLSYIPRGLSWVQPTRWKMLPDDKKIKINVKASVYADKNEAALSQLTSGSSVPKGRHILFEAQTVSGLKFNSDDYDVKWRVVNTDKDAVARKALRGGFYNSSNTSQRWETTEYRGIHWVEAFVIRKRDKACIGESERFFVVIE